MMMGYAYQSLSIPFAANIVTPFYIQIDILWVTSNQRFDTIMKFGRWLDSQFALYTGNFILLSGPWDMWKLL